MENLSIQQQQEREAQARQAEAQHRQNVQRELATQDIGDIEALSRYEPFNRYWVRRMNDMFQRESENSRKGKAPQDREESRIRSNLLEELTQIPATDRKVAQKLLDSAVPGPMRPTQAT